MEEATVLYRREGNIGIITLNRPHRLNALNNALLKTFMGEDTPEIRAKFLASIPIGRFSTPDDMGAAACFLCSDDASMITGVALEVDGGRCI